MDTLRIPEEEDLVFIPNFYENVVFSYRVKGTQLLYGDENIAEVFLADMVEKKYKHSKGIIQHLYYNIDKGKFFVDVKAVPKQPIDNAEPPNLISVREHIPTFEEKPDAWAFLERNQTTESNLEYRKKFLDIRDLLYAQIEIDEDTRLYWKYIDHASSGERIHKEIMYLLNEAARLVLYIPEVILPILSVDEVRRIKSRRVAGLNAIYNKCI